MRYSYDNSLDGLFTVIFEEYRHIENSIIVEKSEQLDFLNDDIYICLLYTSPSPRDRG